MIGPDADPDALARRGRVDPFLAEEFPGLYLRYASIERGSGRSTRGLKERLRVLSDRFAGPQAIAMRNRPIPWAYRVFLRHIGLDPDEQPSPVEALTRERMVKGGFLSQNLLDDAMTIAIVETGVALRALDADLVEGEPAIRPSHEGEGLEGRPGELPAGTLVIADAVRPLALLFGATASGRGVTPKTTRMLILAIGVAGVPEIAVEEALWAAVEMLESA